MPLSKINEAAEIMGEKNCGKIVLFPGDEVKIEAENCKSRYSLEYLKKFVKGAKLSEKVILQFAEDHPLRMDIRGEMELNFILAPRVETD